jgi:HEAT repeat protein
MRRTSTLGTACLLLLAGALRAEPTGRSVASLVEQLQQGDLAARQDAAEALGDLGPAAEEAVPALGRALKDEMTCRPAARALARIGPKALPVLLSMGRDGEHHPLLGDALGRMGPPAVPELARALHDPNQAVRSLAADALGRMGPAAEAALPDLLTALADRRLTPCLRVEAYNWNLPCVKPTPLPHAYLNDGIAPSRRQAGWALGRLGPRAAPALIRVLRGEGGLHGPSVLPVLRSLPRFIGMMRPAGQSGHAVGWIYLAAQTPRVLDSARAADATARRLAAEALGETRPPSPGVVAALTDALDDSDEDVRDAAARALCRLGPAAASAAPALAVWVERLPPQQWRVSVWPLLDLGPAGEDALARRFVPRLLEEIRSETMKDKLEELYRTLEQMGRRGRVSGEALEELVDRHLDRPNPDWLDSGFLAAHPDPVPFLVRLLGDPSVRRRLWAAELLTRLGPRAEAAIPALRRRLTDDPDAQVQRAALEALVAATPDPSDLTPLLVKALAVNHLNGRASELLRRVGPTARQAAPGLRARLADRSPFCAAQAAWSLIELEGPSPAPLDRLAELLTAPEPTYREHAHEALRALGPKARGLAPVLRKRLPSKDEPDPIGLVWTLRRIDPGRPVDLAPLLDGLHHEAQHGNALRALYALGPEAAEAAPELAGLVQTLDADNVDEWSTALAALGRMGPRAAPAVRVLQSLLPRPPRKARDPNDLAALLQLMEPPIPVIDALGRIGPDAAAAVPELRMMLCDPDPETRAAAALALGRIGPAARRAIPRLEEVRDDDDEASPWAAFALARITGDKMHVAWLTRAARRRTEAGEALGELGAAARPALPEVLALLRGDKTARGSAVAALGRMGPEAAGAVPALTRLLDDRRPEVREAAARGLAALGPSARPAERRLRELARADGALAAEAAAALRRLRPRDKGEPSPSSAYGSYRYPRYAVRFIAD